MRSFVDAKGRTWELVVDVYGIRRVRDLLKIDLEAIWESEAKSLGKIIADSCALVDVLYVLCKDQADERGIDDLQFGRGFAGDLLEAAATAFVDEVLNFTPSPAARASQKKYVEKVKKVRVVLEQRAEAELEAMDEAQIEVLARRIIERAQQPAADSAFPPATSPRLSGALPD